MHEIEQLKALVDGLDVFDGLSEKEKNTLLAILESQVYEPGETLCREGDQAFSVFIVCQGNVLISKTIKNSPAVTLGELGPGCILGQVSLIDGKARSATVTAKTPVLTLECSRNDFERLFNAGSPFAFKILDQILVQLTARLRDATKQVYNLYSRPNQTLKTLESMCWAIQRTVHDTYEQKDVTELRSRLR